MHSTAEVCQVLVRQGYRVTCGYVRVSLSEGVMPRPRRCGSSLAWEAKDVAQLCAILSTRRRGPERKLGFPIMFFRRI